MRLVCITLLSLVASCYSQGKEWSEIDVKIIREKIEAFFVREDSSNHRELAKKWLVIRDGDDWRNKNPIPNRYEAITAEELKKGPDGKLDNGADIQGDHYNGEINRDKQNSFKFGSFPNAAKFLRLGFHDCLTYKEGGGGCDGCLNPTNINYRLPNYEQASTNAAGNPIMGKTDNNLLLQTADVLEQIYIDENFPSGTTALSKSMKDKGYSRADLWAFAAMVAVQHGIHQNNYACTKDECRQNCMHIRNGNEEGEEFCMIDWDPKQIKKDFKFRTGRTDCKPSSKMAKWRPFFADKEEVHPNLHSNGPAVLKFYNENFGLTDKEAIALNAGAHSLGKFGPTGSYHTYFWTLHQDKMLNNQVLRNMAQKDAYFLFCPETLVGDDRGRPAKTKWKVNNRRRSDVSNTSGLLAGEKRGFGPFQWVHSFERCNANEWCSNVLRNNSTIDEVMNDKDDLCDSKDNLDKVEQCKDNLDRLPEPTTTCGIDDCCKDLEEGQYCKREQCSPCFGNIGGDDHDVDGSIARMETATASDMGLVFKFDFDEETGIPSGCPGFDEDPKWKRGRTVTVEPRCPPADTAGIVEELAEDTERWKRFFLKAMTKMVQNGYQDGQLHQPKNEWIQNENEMDGCLYKYEA